MTWRTPRAVVPMLFVLCIGGRANAHPLTPASLAIREVEPGVLEVRFRTTRLRPRGERLLPELPPRCQRVEGSERDEASGDSLSLRYRVRCGPGRHGGLDGAHVGVAGIAGSPANVVLELRLRGGERLDALLDAARPRVRVDDRSLRSPDTLASYLALGIRHLVTGLDHVLFVLGLVFLVRGLARLAALVTAFTVGHTASLALAAFGAVRLPSAPVEVAIAASLVWLGLRVLDRSDEPSSEASPREPFVALAFGLVHGLGFAGAFREAGASDESLPRALLGFNLGIEVAQLAFVTVAAIVLGQVERGTSGPARGRRVAGAVAYAIGGTSAYLLLQRVPALFGL